MKFVGIRENKPKEQTTGSEQTFRRSENRIKSNESVGDTEHNKKNSSLGKDRSKKERFYTKWFQSVFISKWDIDKVRSLIGTFIMLGALFLLVAFASHLFYYGTLDQSAVEILSEQNAENNGGYFGAVFAKFFITDGFGIVALFLPFYMFIIGYAVSENKYWDLVKKIFPYALFTIYWGAVVLAFLKIVFMLPFQDLGGGVGLSINEWIGYYIGRFGTGLFLIFSLLVFVNYKLKSQVGIFGFVGSLLAKYDRKEHKTPDLHFPSGDTEGFSAPQKEEKNNRTDEANENLDKDELEDGFIISVKKINRDDDVPFEDGIDSMDYRNSQTTIDPIDVQADTLQDGYLQKDQIFESEKPESTPPTQPQVEFIIDQGIQEALFIPHENATKLVENQVSPDETKIISSDVSIPLFEFQTGQLTDLPIVFKVDDEWEPATFDGDTDPGGIQFLMPDRTFDFVIEKSKNTNPTTLVSNMDVQDEGGDIELIIEPTDTDLPLPFSELYHLESEEVTYISKEIAPYDPTRDLSNFTFPSIDLLELYEGNQQREINREELEANKDQIVRTLSNYGIEITSIKATIGPTVTLYEIIPAAGVRISKIKNLEDDIALGLAALGIRIIAPMPGKGTIGIEIPNSKPEMVSFRNVVSTEKFQNSEAILPIGLGRTISNEVYVLDLAKMPHLLVAGATGQGKSVGLNTIIASILYKKHPGQVKFVLIDPKKVELSLYQALEYHYLAKLPNLDDAIITDNKDVIHVLNSLCKEMDDRYKLLQDARVRHIEEYNTKFIDRKLNPEKGHKYLPYIILIIDELADLMFTAGKEIEMPIARLAQLARAIGIHLVVATQRPSVNVITGLIKANFPARMSYRVTQKIDSRTILDTNGAEQLIGRGDLLLMKDGELVRVQNAFIDTSEVERIVDYISKQQRYPQPYLLPEVSDGEDGDNNGADLTDRDPLFEEAARLLVSLNSGSTSSIQQHMKIGYNRAARIMLQLEKAGIVSSPAGGNKPREILIKSLYELEQYL